MALRRALLAWYRRAARDLPWRRTRDPWAIWVSEVMLQQTRVKTALSFYPSFLERFPTPKALADADEPRVLAAWSGLGYYRRARQLHAAAREVVREHAGRVPSDAQAFGRLPGVGRYTRAAVLSMGFGAQHAVLDGNVGRVLSRIFAMRAGVRDPRGARQLWALADSLIPRDQPGDWNQALMELGALICTPRAPRCDECPLARMCRAHQSGRVAQFPPAPPQRRVVRVRRAVVLMRRRGRLLMTQRNGALLAGLWEPPGVELKDGENAGAALGAALARLGLQARLSNTGKIVRHAITHRSIEVELWCGVAPREAEPPTRVATAQPARWVARGRGDVPLTALARRISRMR